MADPIASTGAPRTLALDREIRVLAAVDPWVEHDRARPDDRERRHPQCGIRARQEELIAQDDRIDTRLARGVIGDPGPGERVLRSPGLRDGSQRSRGSKKETTTEVW